MQSNNINKILEDYDNLVYSITHDVLTELKETYFEEYEEFDYDNFLEYVDNSVKSGIGILEDLGKDDFIIIAADYINRTGNLEFNKNTLLRHIHFDVLDSIDCNIDSYCPKSK